MKRITQTNEIQSGNNSGVTISGIEKVRLSHPFELSEFETNDLITLKVALELNDQNNPANILSPWTPAPTQTDQYRTHPIDGIEYLFRSLIDANTSEPSFDSTLGAWTMTEKFGSVPAFQSSFPPNIGGWVTGDSNSKVYEALTSGNTVAPSGGITDANWKYIGTYKGSWSEFGFYQIGDVVYDTSDGNRRYISNIADNEQPLSDHGGGSTWVLIGPKPFTPDASEKGEVSFIDQGQVGFIIPHTLGSIPSWYSVTAPSDLNARNILNSSVITAEETGIRIIPQFLNNDGAELNFLWKAEL